MCSPVNLLRIFGTPFPKNTSGGLLLNIGLQYFKKWVILDSDYLGKIINDTECRGVSESR